MPAQKTTYFTSSLTMQALAVAVLAKLVVVLTGLGEDAATAIATDLAMVALSVVSILADLVAAYGRKRAQGPVTFSAKETPDGT